MSEVNREKPTPTPTPDAPGDATHDTSSGEAGSSESIAAFTGGDDALRDRIVEALHSCYDPEIPVDIYELGLIYNVDIADDQTVNLRMTLTSPMCPVAGTLPGEVEVKVKGVEGVKDAKVELVWDPPWGMEKMSEVAKLKLQI